MLALKPASYSKEAGKSAKESANIVHTPDFELGITASTISDFRMFSRLPSVFKGWNVVRVPPRAQCFRRSEAFVFLLLTKLDVSINPGCKSGATLVSQVATNYAVVSRLGRVAGYDRSSGQLMLAASSGKLVMTPGGRGHEALLRV